MALHIRLRITSYQIEAITSEYPDSAECDGDDEHNDRFAECPQHRQRHNTGQRRWYFPR